METSCFWRFIKDPENPRLVAITAAPPKWYKGRCYPALAPRWKMLMMDETTYRKEYRKMLDRLNPKKVFEDLGADAILLCWEHDGNNCHRRIVAEWLEEKLGVRIEEIPFKAGEKQKKPRQLALF